MAEDSEPSFILSHNYQGSHLLSDDKNKINKELTLKLLELTSENKLQLLHPDLLRNLRNDIISLINLKKISFSSKELSDKFCSVCKDFFTIPLQCGCFICSHLYQTIDIQLQEYFANTLTDLYEFLETVKCPKCDQRIEEKDLEKMYPEFRTKKDELQLLKSRLSIKQHGHYTCENCGKARGPEMMPSPDVLKCNHMCNICICKEYLENRSVKCKHCEVRIDIEALSYDKRECKRCGNSCYLLGDRMLESSPGILLCLFCIADSVNKGSCPVSGKIFTFEEKREFYQYIFTQCNKCGTDIFHLNAERLRCCKQVFCSACTNLGYCPQCKIKF